MPLTGNHIPYNAFTHSITGISHEAKQKPNQDAVAYIEELSLLVVADGHGSAAHPLSHIGSAMAVAATTEVLFEYRDMLTELNGIKERLCFLENDVAYAIEQSWKAKVHEAFENGNKEQLLYETKSIETLYGTTLIIGFIFENVFYSMQIGDGVVVIYEKKRVVMPILEDERLHENVTTSLCEPNSWLSMRAAAYKISDETQMIALLTDGVENAYPSGEIDAIDFYEEILMAQDQFQEIPQGLIHSLEKASKFSRDDTSGAFWIKNSLEPLDENILIEKRRLEAGTQWVPTFLETQPYYNQLAWLRKNTQMTDQNTWLFSGLSLKELVIDEKGGVHPLDHQVDDIPVIEAECFNEIAAMLIEKKPKSYVQVSHYPNVFSKWREFIDSEVNAQHICHVCGQNNSGETELCIQCDSKLSQRVYIENAYESHQLFYNSEILLHHLMPLKGKFDPVIGRVVQHPKYPSIWGIENQSGQTWYINGNEEQGKTVQIGQKVPVKNNVRINLLGLFVKIMIK